MLNLLSVDIIGLAFSDAKLNLGKINLEFGIAGRRREAKL